MLAMSACGLVLSVYVMKYMLKLPYSNYSKSLTRQFSIFLRDLLARINLCIAASRASTHSLAAKWYYDEAQGAVFCFICILRCTYVLMVTLLIIHMI